VNLKLQQASRVLNQGGLLVYPTESVFGLGCLAKNEVALEKLRNIKRRQSQKGLIVLCSSVEQLKQSFPQIQLDQSQSELLQSNQPHPTTWLIPYPKKHFPLLVGNNNSIAIRITKHPEALALCKKCGPIISSSANIAGQRTPDSLLKARKTFGTQVDFYLNAALGNSRTPSQIIDLLSGEIIRSA